MVVETGDELCVGFSGLWICNFRVALYLWDRMGGSVDGVQPTSSSHRMRVSSEKNSVAFEFSSRDWESFRLSHLRTVWTVVMLGTELASEKIGSSR